MDSTTAQLIQTPKVVVVVGAVVVAAAAAATSSSSSSSAVLQCFLTSLTYNNSGYIQVRSMTYPNFIQAIYTARHSTMYGGSLDGEEG